MQIRTLTVFLDNMYQYPIIQLLHDCEFNRMIMCECAYRNCVNGTYYYPVSGSDDRRCVYTCETTSTCGNVTIPADHLKVSAAAINTLSILLDITSNEHTCN